MARLRARLRAGVGRSGRSRTACGRKAERNGPAKEMGSRRWNWANRPAGPAEGEEQAIGRGGGDQVEENHGQKQGLLNFFQI